MASDADQNTIDQAATQLIRLSKAEPFQTDPIDGIKKEFVSRGQLDDLADAFRARSADTLSMARFERTYGILKG